MGTHQKYFDTTPWPFHRPQPNLSDFSGTVRIILWLTQWAAPVNHVSRRFWDLLTNLVAIAPPLLLDASSYRAKVTGHVPSRIDQASHRFISGQLPLKVSSPGRYLISISCNGRNAIDIGSCPDLAYTNTPTNKLRRDSVQSIERCTKDTLGSRFLMIRYIILWW